MQAASSMAAETQTTTSEGTKKPGRLCRTQSQQFILSTSKPHKGCVFSSGAQCRGLNHLVSMLAAATGSRPDTCSLPLGLQHGELESWKLLPVVQPPEMRYGGRQWLSSSITVVALSEEVCSQVTKSKQILTPHSLICVCI